MSGAERRAAIVTGSDSGIGRAAALALARDGFDIGVTWHSDEAGAHETARLISERRGTARIARLDLASPDEVQRVIEGLIGDLGRLDALINNAAVDHRAHVLEETLEDWTRVLAINLTGQFLCAQAGARQMVAQGEGGQIVNITSIHEHHPVEGGCAYAAAKGGLGMLTKAIALDLAPHQITANAIAPGHIATPMTGTSDGDPSARAGIPLGRIGQAQEVADLVAHLCSPSAGYITGVSYPVDGGLGLMTVHTLVQSI